MNVLSLFDGISCGQIALNKANIPYNNYFASEIDKNAIKVTQHHYPNTIQLGDVTKIEFIASKIDLLIGGSPCQSFSSAGNRNGFDGKSGLFWEYVRVLKEVNPTYFLLENVVMKKEWKDIITNELGVEPIVINSSLVSAQNRKRLYWTNIEGIEQPENRKIYLKDILEPIVDDKYYISKIAIEKLNRHNNKVIKETSLPEKSGTIHAGYFKMGGRDQQYIKDIPICVNSKGGRNGIPGLQPSLQDRIYLDEGKFTAITPSFMPYVITIDSHHSESELKCVGALGGNKKWLDNGKNLQRNFSQGERIYSTDGKSPCLSANSGGSTGIGNALITDDINDKYNIRKLTPIECERLQTVPDNYTEGVSNTQRYKMLGNGWTVDVIAHIFKNIEI
jgi:DNA (cytosine-5)-methyltransferase 3A